MGLEFSSSSHMFKEKGKAICTAFYALACDLFVIVQCQSQLKLLTHQPLVRSLKASDWLLVLQGDRNPTIHISRHSKRSYKSSLDLCYPIGLLIS